MRKFRPRKPADRLRIARAERLIGESERLADTAQALAGFTAQAAARLRQAVLDEALAPPPPSASVKP